MKAFKAKGGTKEMLQKIKQAAPKKCLSAYMIFVRETRCRIQTENPEMPALQIMKEVGKEWQELDAAGRAQFQAKADLDKGRFRREKNQFETKMKRLMSNPELDPAVLEDSLSQSEESKPSSSRSQRRRDKDSKPRKPKDPNAPRRSLSTFIYFSQAVRNPVP